MKTSLIFSTLLIATVVGSCCKVYCPRESMAMQFIGFTPEDIDTIIIRKYEPPNFTTPIDSSVRYMVSSPLDTLRYDYFDSDGFQFSKNYEIAFPSISKSYQISELKSKKEDCNCGQKDGKRVSGYKLDALTFVNDAVNIHK